MRTIWKFDLAVSDRVVARMPEGAKVLEVNAQDPTGRTVQVWALVEPDADPEERVFHIAGTGHPLPDNCHQGNHLASVVTAGGALVWHVFDLSYSGEPS